MADESQWLAGFGTEYARECHRIVDTSLGQALVLVGHDIHALNHRMRKNVSRTATITDRGKVTKEMVYQMNTHKGAVRPGGFAEENHQAFASLMPACHFVEMDNLGLIFCCKTYRTDLLVIRLGFY